MSVEFVLGPARSGKTTAIQQEISLRSRQEPERKILYVVPEQMTLSAQQALLALHPDHGVLNTEILSFNRLAHRVFEETGMVTDKILDDMGKSMVLYKIACDHQEELSYYRASVRQRGFIGQMKIMMTELYQYGVGDDQLRQLAESQPEDSILRAKWQDIQTIRRYFEEYTAREMISSEQLLDILAGRIGQSRLVEGALIYFDDFNGFTPQQYRVLEGLIRRAERVTFCLSMTPGAWKMAQSVQQWQELPMTLFRETQKTLIKLQSMARKGRIPYRCRWTDAAGEPSALQTLREGLFLPGTPRWEQPQQAVFAQIADNPKAELDQLMHEVLHLVRSEGYRYRDIAVIAGDPEGCGHALRRKLELYQIPCYMDQKTDILLNPYAQLIVQSLKMVWNGCAYESVFSFLKTGLTPLEPEQVDEWENQALRENWRGAPQYIRELRRREEWTGAGMLADALEAFFAASAGEKRTAGERLKALEELLLALEADRRMQEKSEAFREEGRLLKAMEYERMPELLKAVRERAAEVMGDLPMGAAEFSHIMDLGLEQCRMGTLPPSLDQMIVGDMERTRLGQIKVLFVIGFQDGSFPKADRAPGLLTRRERETSSSLAELAPVQREDLMQQYLQLYTLLGKASDRVYFSCHRGSGNGQLQNPALLWKRLESLLPLNPWPDRSGELTLPQPCLTEHSGRLSEPLKRWYRENGSRDLIRKLEEARREQVPRESLSPDTVRELMDLQNRSCSVSQIEQYARCPFSYFLRYGLRLKEREKPEVRSLDDGNVLHEILEEAGEWFAGLWGEEAGPGEQELKDYVAELYENKKEEYAVYQTTGRYRYYWNKLQKTASYAIDVLNEQLSAGDFKPEAFEWTFGRGRTRPLEIPLEGGGSLKLQGKIDRVDVLNRQDGSYLRIIDYKSGSTTYKEEEIYAGLQLQLPIYMEAARESGAFGADGPVKPAGIFYFHLTPKIQKGKDGLSPEEKKENRLAEARLDGLLLEDQVIAEKMDRSLLTKPRVLRARISQEGRFYKGDKTATERQFARLGRFARGKVAQAAEEIRQGRMPALPVQTAGQRVCSFCEFRGACRYDPGLPGAQVRKMEKLDADEFWSRLEQEEP